MDVSIQYIKMPASETLSEYTEKRLNKLASKYQWVIKAEVIFKLENDNLGQKICEIELSLPGPRIFAISKEKNFEMAVKNTLSDVERQLKKRKETMYHH